jgi:hypothetical protein
MRYFFGSRCGGRCVRWCGRFGWDSPRKRLFLSRNIEGATAAGNVTAGRYVSVAGRTGAGQVEWQQWQPWDRSGVR